ncbi:hypothetical protein BLOT_008866 [Blomia tropicalis]|nr:hypothetical protein BLOT_008866 [Blomia tropicalis]
MVINESHIQPLKLSTLWSTPLHPHLHHKCVFRDLKFAKLGQENLNERIVANPSNDHQHH